MLTDGNILQIPYSKVNKNVSILQDMYQLGLKQ
jgi:hypothetical protein